MGDFRSHPKIASTPALGTETDTARGGRLARGLLEAPTFRYLQAAMLVVLAIAFVTSFDSGSAGARMLGYPAMFVAALPLVCDVVAGVATFIHGRVRGDKKMRRLAAQFVLVPMLLSWGANAVDHVNRSPAPAGAAPFDITKMLVPPPAPSGWSVVGHVAWLVGVVLAAGICPVAVAALLHLSTKYVEFEQRAEQRATERATRQRVTASAGHVAETVTASPDPVASPVPPGGVPAVSPDELARARELVAKGRQDGGKYGRASLARDLGVTPHRARELLAQIDAVHLVVGA